MREVLVLSNGLMFTNVDGPQTIYNDGNGIQIIMTVGLKIPLKSGKKDVQ